MRLLELHIEKVRGITDLTLKPNGKNMVIWGPNGSGKSAVIDAIDFLLTGKITRLTGIGTAGLSLSAHGPHVGHSSDEALVRAIVQLPGMKKPVTLERCMAKPKILKCETDAKHHFAPIQAVADQGQHVLTRREILRYITAEAGTRAAQIQALLSLSEVEEIRRNLVKTHGDLSKEYTGAQTALDSARADVKATTQLETFDPASVLAKINFCRTLLSGTPLVELSGDLLKEGLVPPDSNPKEPTINLTLLEKDTESLRQYIHGTARSLIAADDLALRDLLLEVRRDPALLKALNQEELVQQGIALLDDSGACPLCDTVWESPLDLQDHLKKKAERAEIAKACRERIEALSAKVAEATRLLLSVLRRVSGAAQIIGQQGDYDALKDWTNLLDDLNSLLASPLDQYPTERFGSGDVMQLLAPNSIQEILTRIMTAATERLPRATPERTAWDTLTLLEANLKALKRTQEQHRQAEIAKTRAFLMLTAFQEARDKVLGDLYDNIRTRFVHLYRGLHGSDEENFTAKLAPDGAALNLEVDFYGRGMHPPHALHSEGHQDSMGLCLYLALSERLTQGVIDLILLDDVVMSVDADHRRHLCGVLASEFPERQFLITTHDRQWATQLKTEGVVRSGSSIEFSHWNIDTGPRVSDEADLFGKIRADLANGDVPSASHKLRRGSEEFFAETCEALNARVPFRMTAKWELGELMPAAVSRYRDLLGKAKNAAQSWKADGAMDQLKELDSVASQVYQRTQAEQWAVNVNIHYNAWANFKPNDFAPVVTAFEDFFGIFHCSNCKQRLQLLADGPTEKALMCSCGHVSWNLQGKPKS